MHPDERIYTFWDYFRQHWPRDRGLRIDHLLLSKDLAARLKDANVDRWVRDLPKASDHAPTWVELGSAARKPGPARKPVVARKAAVKKTVVKKATARKSAAKAVKKPAKP
jgi:exodeoxyribonuclease-3